VPSEISESIVNWPWRSAATARAWKSHPAHSTIGVDRTKAAQGQPSNISGGIIEMASNGMPRMIATHMRRRASAISSSPKPWDNPWALTSSGSSTA
jgi:hypothetical protein